MKFPTTSLGFALLALTTISAAEPQDPTKNDAIDSAGTAITDFIINR
ncbi:hypothetical protein [Pseudomonas tohonis]|nr:hypothetical protein [Pseudomonas tohonis]